MRMESECPGCGKPLANSNGFDGLCPICLLQQGLKSGSLPAKDAGSLGDMTEGLITPGVLAAGTESLADVPQTLLRDSDPGPLVLPGSSEMPRPDPSRAGRLQLLGEIARGGMGAVLKGRDNDIGRDLAVKVLLDSHRDHPELIRRFIEEAQIGGQLQHPGIVPIYELGTFSDKRPYFAMKLVKGRTLASLLEERDGPGRDLPRFLSIFEAICQTMAYAHSRGVIHRDLKPSNVMVGSFGEVQVMDWGLAKVLPHGGAVDDASAGKTKNEDTVIATARSGGSDGDSDLSRAGSVMGTPAYMAPEQARGETDRLDERTDVFALGSILCEILTGFPAFTGRSSGEIQRKAARGDLKESLARLEAATIDIDLILLCKDCLGSESEDRPRHAGIIADRVQAHRMSVEERLRQTEIARAEENARAQEAAKRARVEQERLRLRVALAGALLGLIGMAGGGLYRLSQIKTEQQAATDREVNQAISEANVLLGAAKAAPTGDLSKWAAVEAAVKHAQARLKIGDTSAGIKDQVSRLQVALDKEHAAAVHRAEELERDRKLVERLERVRNSRFEKGEQWNANETIADYKTAFRQFGVDIDQLDPAEAGRRLRERTNPQDLAFFLDDWACIERETFDGDERATEKLPWLKLIAVARSIDADPWRDALCKLVGSHDRNAIKQLAADDKALQTQPPRAWLLLSRTLEANGEFELAEKLLKRAWSLNPDDFWICSQLGNDPYSQSTTRTRSFNKERARFASCAVALRPKNAWAHVALAKAVLASNDPIPLSLSGAVFKVTASPVVESGLSMDYRFRLRQRPLQPLDCLAFFLNPEDVSVVFTEPYTLPINHEVVDELRIAIALSPAEASVYVALARVLAHQDGKLNEALETFHRAISLGATRGLYLECAAHLYLCGQLGEAISEARKAMDAADVGFPSNSLPNIFIGHLLLKNGDVPSAALEFQKAFLGADDGSPEQTIAKARLHATAKPEDELEAYKLRVRSRPTSVVAVSELAGILGARGNADEAIGVYREAVRLSPLIPEMHAMLGRALRAQNKFVEAKVELTKELRLYIEAVRQKPASAKAHENLGNALLRRGNLEEGQQELREAARLDASVSFRAYAFEWKLRGKLALAIAFFREAARREPSDAVVRNDLGCELLNFGEVDDAITEIRESLRLIPNVFEHLDSLGWTHYSRGEFKEAVATLRDAIKLRGEWADPEVRAHLKQAERLSALQDKIDVFLHNQNIPEDAESKRDIGELCRLTKRFAASSKFYQDAVKQKPALAADLSAQLCLHAAISAAQAGTQANAVKDDLSLTTEARASERARALGWLRGDLAACGKLLAIDEPAQTAEARRVLEIMTYHRDLSVVRDKDSLAKIPEPERKLWEAFWGEVSGLIVKADQQQ